VIYIVSLIVTLGVLIAFHEFGHFWVARRLGVKVLRFSIGFGKPLWLRRAKDGTEYAIAAIPLGGYVRMLDEREGDVPASQRDQAFNRQSVWVRIAIVSAGPVFNFIFAILIYAIIFMVGTTTLRPMFAAPQPDSIAARGGFQDGDVIVRIGTEEISTLNSALLSLVDHSLSKDVLEVEVMDKNNRSRMHTLDFRGTGDLTENGELLSNLGLVPWQPHYPAVIDQVNDNSPAAAAGLESGDRIIAVDGKTVTGWHNWAEMIQAKPEQRLTLLIERNKRELSIPVTPEAIQTDNGTIGRVGAYPRIPVDLATDNQILVRYGPLEAVFQGAVKTWDMSWFTLRMLGRMLVGQISLENISGPITIAQFAGQSAMIGISAFLTFMALVSISLGVLNLLPVPILDGGHLLYYFIEIIKGSPLSESIQYVGQQMGMAVIVMLMGLALFNDFTRLLG
jgi:regulator of sigma E protease